MPLEMSPMPTVRLEIILAIMLAIAAPIGSGQAPGVSIDARDRAVALEQQGNVADAEAAWHTVLKGHPDDGEAYAHLGLLEARQEHYKEAVPLYRKALALKPGMPGLRLNLGLALFKSGALKESIQVFTPLLKNEPASSLAAQRLTALIGIAHYGLGELAAAVPYLKSAAISDPQNLQFRLLLAHSCLATRQFQCVLDVYREILTLNAESAEADMLAGEAYDEMRNHAAAIEQFRAAVKADPKEPNVHFGLGYLLWSQNQFEEAAKEFQAELVNVPRSAQALAFLADSDMQLNQQATALPLIEQAIQIDPKLGRAHLDLGILYADSGRREDAIREFQLAAKLVPDDSNPHWRLARLYQSMGRKEDARIEFEKTSKLHKAANDTIMSNLKHTQDKGSTEDNQAAPLTNK
jgi:tetratricopeptide (TPR) repeat protein